MARHLKRESRRIIKTLYADRKALALVVVIIIIINIERERERKVDGAERYLWHLLAHKGVC